MRREALTTATIVASDDDDDKYQAETKVRFLTDDLTDDQRSVKHRRRATHFLPLSL